MRSSIWNLYRQICWRKGVPVEAKRNELEKQLLLTKRTIVELVKIVRIAKKKARQEIREKERDQHPETLRQDENTVRRIDTRVASENFSMSTFWVHFF